MSYDHYSGVADNYTHFKYQPSSQIETTMDHCVTFRELSTASGGYNLGDHDTSGSVMTSNVLPEEFPYRLPGWGIVILIIGYALVFIFGVAGNCSVLFVVIRLRRMKTVTNYFIFSLAMADLLVLLFCMLPNLMSNIFIRKSCHHL